MLMQTLPNVVVNSPLNSFERSRLTNVRDRAIRCLRKNGEISGLFRAKGEMEAGESDRFEVPEEGIRLPHVEPEAKQSEIWKLFRQAQQNILYLNKQRLTAVEELNKLKKQHNLLLERIHQLETESPRKREKDKLSLLWELLHRIDSLVLGNFVGAEEASNLRSLAIENKTGVADDFSDILQRSDAQILADLRRFSDKNKRTRFHIIHICTEMQPLVSIGPLASYVTGLSCALQGRGHLVEVILPKYTSLQLDEVQGLREIDDDSFSYFNGQLHGNRIWTGVVYGIGVTLIQPLKFSSYFNREKVYGYSDDFERFIYFSRASLDYIVKSGKQPDVLHIHNWETSVVGPLFWDIFVKQGLEKTRVLLTCQGFDSQCLVEPDKLALCGLDPLRLNRPDRLQDNMRANLVNVLKGGIVYSNKVVLMSSIHSKRKIIYGVSHGLEPTLDIHKEKVLVAPFGFDNSSWDPTTDKFLPETYCAEDMKGKAVCKVALQKQLGLSENVSTVIVGCLSFELSNVGLENLKTTIRTNYMRNIQFVLMGKSKVQNMNRELEELKEEFKDRSVKLVHSYDEALLHLLFAGSDVILCESFLAPLVETPLKALKYGAAPVTMTSNGNIFRHFGDDSSESTRFAQFMSSAFGGNMTLREALDHIKNNPLAWKQKTKEAMSRDFSWDAECCDIHESAYTSIKNL